MPPNDAYRKVLRAKRAASEAVAELDAMPADTDEENAHGEADRILCEVLRESGLNEVADAFERARDRVGFWYS